MGGLGRGWSICQAAETTELADAQNEIPRKSGLSPIASWI
jgi:hypothetical protein